MALALQAERVASCYDKDASLLAMATVIAPPAPEDEVATRAPLELVAIVDRSGSMSGEKITLMKSTLKLLIKHGGLSDSDTLGIVTFDSHISTILPLTSMNSQGRAAAAAAVESICVGGQTNLSGGLLQGLDMLCSSVRRECDAESVDGEEATLVSRVSRSALLFTDGHANVGITQHDELIRAAQAVLRGAPGATVFTFGYGCDHDEDLLRGLSKLTTGGLFYHIDQPDAIPNAFADCLGGLVSVVAQNATLELKCPGGRKRTSTISAVLSDAYKPQIQDDGVCATLEIGDLYVDDEKDVLYKLSLCKQLSPVDEPQAVVEASLRYFNVALKQMVEVQAQLLLARPAEEPEWQAPNIKLDEQSNRLDVAAAIERATALADGGELASGKAVLDAAVAKISASASSNTELSRTLVGDLQRLALDYDEVKSYRSLGSKRSKASAMCHSLQRPSPMTSVEYSAGSKGKGALRSLWTY